MSDRACNGYIMTASAIAHMMIPEVDANNNLANGVGTADYKGYQAVAGAVVSRVPASFFLQRQQCGGAGQQGFSACGRRPRLRSGDPRYHCRFPRKAPNRAGLFRRPILLGPGLQTGRWHN
jgi:hypothetical protein